MAPVQRTLSLTVFFLVAACALPATNPYDPETPLDQQARGIITGTTALLPLTGGSSVPLGGAIIALTQGPSAPQTQTSANDGTFTFTSLMAGTYTLTATHSSAYPTNTSVTVTPGGTETTTLQLLPVPSSGVSGTMNINGGATVTNQRQVVINLLSQGAATMLISEDPTFTNPSLGATTPVAYNTTASYTLAPADGAQTVYVQLIGGSGATLLLSAVITLDTQPPTSPTLAASLNASGWTSNSQVVLSLGAVGASTMQISCNGAAALTSAPVQPFVPTSMCTVGPTPAAYGIAALYFDAAGNEATPLSLTAYYDPTPPTSPVVAGVGEIVNATTFTVSLATSATDAPISGDPGGPTFAYQLQGGTYTGWQDCGTSLPAVGWPQISGCSGPPFTFPLVANSTNNLRVRARDRAGNVSSDSALTVVADSVAPGVVLHQGSTGAPTPTWGSADVAAGIGTATVTWEPPAAVDVAGYLVYYGVGPSNANVPSLFTGTTADQGPSPIDVGKPCVSNPNGNDCTFRLTGLADGSPIIVSVVAYDMTQVPGPNVGPMNSNAATATPQFMILHTAATLSPAAWGPANANARAVAVRDGVAVVTSGDSGKLAVVDVGIPSQPTVLGVLPSALTAGYDVALQGTYAYVADGTTGLLAVDISTPASPVVAGVVTGLGNVVSAVDVQGDHLFVTSTTLNTGNGHGNLTVLTTNPNELATASAAQPLALGSFHTGSTTSFVDVAAQGNMVFLAANTPAVFVLDATVPTSLSVVGTCTTSGNVEGVAVSGQYVYASAGGNITLCDVSNPASPTVVGTIPITSSGRRVTAAGGYVYTTSTQGLFVSPLSLDANGVPSLGTTASMATAGYNSDGGTYMPAPGNIAASGTTLLVAAGSNGLQVLTTASPNRLQTLGTVSPGGAIGSGSSLGLGNLVVASVETGWEALHWSAIDPNAYAATGVLGSAAYQLDAAPGLVVGTDRGNGAVYGATVLNNKTWTAAQTYTPTGAARAYGLVVRWPYAFVATDVGNVSAPLEIANTLEVIDLRAFAAVGNVTFAPGTAAAPVTGRVATYGNYVYVTNGSGTNNLVVINTATPTAPAVVGNVTDASHTYGDIAASGQHLYVTHGAGFRVLSFKPPYSALSPTDVGGYDALTGFQPDSIAVSGSTVFLTGGGGAAIFNITFNGDVPTVQLVALHTTGITGQGLTVGGTSAVVNNAAGPVQFLKLQ